MNPILYKHFSERIKKAYPEYKSIDDETLARRIVEMYPEYDSVIFPSDESALMNSEIERKRKEQHEADLETEYNPLQSAALGASRFVMPMTTEAAESGNEGISDLYKGPLDIAANIATLPSKGASTIARESGKGLEYLLANIAGTDDMSGQDLALTVGAAGIPVAGRALATGAGNLAPGILHYATKPILKKMENPPDFKRMLDERLFAPITMRGAYKKLNKIITPKVDALNEAMKRSDENGIVLSVDDIREDARRAIESDVKMTETAKEKALSLVDNEFDLITDKYKKWIKPTYHNEAVPNPEFEPALQDERLRVLNINNPRKAKYTRDFKKWDKDPIASYLDRPEPPELERFRKPDIEEWNIEQIESTPGHYTNNIQATDARMKKSGLQELAFDKSSQNETGMARGAKEISRAINRSLADLAPDIRNADIALAPYKNVEDVLARRLKIPAQSRIMPGLNDVATMEAISSLTDSKLGTLSSLLASILTRTTKGAQTLYDISKYQDEGSIPKLLTVGGRKDASMSNAKNKQSPISVLLQKANAEYDSLYK